MGIAEHAGALPAGTRVGDFQIEHVIGHPGHFGITYVARDAEQRKVALKEYFPVEIAQRDGEAVKLRRDEDQGIYKWGLRGFLDECEQLVRFSHASIVKGHRVWEANGTAYFAMEYIEGESLAELLQREGRMGEARLRAFLMPVIDGVRHAHEAGLLHRDICPTDIRIAGNGRPVLTDFAGARNVLRFKSRSTAHAFTPGYAPPEEYVVTGKQGAWTDVYSLAGVAYRAVTGHAPVEAPARQKGTPMKAASELAAGRYPDHFLHAIDWGLRLDSAQRPQKIADWQAALDGEQPAPVFESEPAGATPAVEGPAAPMPVPTLAVPIEPRRTPRAEAAAGTSGGSGARPAAQAPAKSAIPAWAIAAGIGTVVVVGALVAMMGGQKDPAPAAQTLAPASGGAATLAAPAADPLAADAASDAPAAAAAADDSELTGLDRIALQLMQQEQVAREQEALAAEAKAAEDAERAKRELAAREQAAKEQAALQRKLEEEQNDARRRQLEQEQARLRAEEEARLKAEAERVAAQTVATAQPAAAPLGAVPQKRPEECRIHVSQLTDSGKLTYQDAKRARGAVIDPVTGIIRLPPVAIAGGRHAVFEILPDGCARMRR